MTDGTISFIFITVCTILVAAFAATLTHKAQQQGHNDNDGIAYYYAMWVMGTVYTVGDMILLTSYAN